LLYRHSPAGGRGIALERVVDEVDRRADARVRIALGRFGMTRSEVRERRDGVLDVLVADVLENVLQLAFRALRSDLLTVRWSHRWRRIIVLVIRPRGSREPHEQRRGSQHTPDSSSPPSVHRLAPSCKRGRTVDAVRALAASAAHCTCQPML